MSTIEKLISIKKKSMFYQNMSFFGTVFICILLYFFRDDVLKLFGGFFLGLAICIMLGTRASKYDKMFRAKYKSVFVKNMLSERLDDVHYEWKRGFTGPELYDLQLFNYKGHISDDYLKASYKGVHFIQADVIHSDQKRHGGHTFKGKVMIISNPFAELKGIWIYTKKFNYSTSYASQSLDILLLEDSEFAEVFSVYTALEITKKDILTTEIKQRLLLLAKKYQRFGVRFNGQQMCVVIEDSRDTFDLDNESKKVIYEAEVERIGQDIADIIEVIEVLGNIKE